MSLHDAGVVAGTVSTVLFVASYLPMLSRAARTRDLSSYSPGNLLLANLGNLVHSLYVFSLPAGPLWLLHTFYLVSSALMLSWWCRHHGPVRLDVRPHLTPTSRSTQDTHPPTDRGGDRRRHHRSGPRSSWR
jgi:hypothetical protein